MYIYIIKSYYILLNISILVCVYIYREREREKAKFGQLRGYYLGQVWPVEGFLSGPSLFLKKLCASKTL